VENTIKSNHPGTGGTGKADGASGGAASFGVEAYSQQDLLEGFAREIALAIDRHRLRDAE
jgi:hypothetical protein